MVRTLLTSMVVLLCVNLFAQYNENGLLKLEKKRTFWDKENKILRSEGDIQVTGFTGVGEKFGKWTFYFKEGGVEERSNFYQGKYNGRVQQFYPSRKKMFEGYFFLGVQDSIFKIYHENGNLAEEGMYNSIPDSIRDTVSKYWNIIEYIEPVKVGTWKRYYEDGKPWEVVEYKVDDTTEYLVNSYDATGKLQVSNGNGVVKETFASGKPKLEQGYKDGLKHGRFKSWNANGSLKEEGEYNKGMQAGDWIYHYFVSKNIYQKVSFLDGKKHGDFVEYMPNDTMALEGSYSYGVKHGKWEYYFENGSMDMTGNFKDGFQDGHWQYFYPSGQLYYEGDYVEGKKTGEWQFYYGNGQLWREGNYRDDLKDGPWDFYYENGGDLMQGGFEKGEEHGAWISYYENGQEKDRGSYDHGKMTAGWEGWYPNGKQSYKGWYQDDMKTGKWEFYTSKGKLKDQGEFKILKYKEGESVSYNFSLVEMQSYKHGAWKSYSDVDYKIVSDGSYYRGRQSGVWKYYYPGGKVIAYENSYNNKGKLDGVSKTYSRRGKESTEISYKDGLKHGSCKAWDKKGNLIQHLVYKNGVKIKDEITKTTFKYRNEK